MNKENKMVKVFFVEEEFKQFSDVEKLIKDGMPSFDDDFKKEIVKKISQKHKKGNFLLKSAIAASLIIVAFSFFLLRPVLNDEANTVSGEAINEVLISVGGSDELRLDEVLDIVEKNNKDNSKKYEDYIKYYLGGNDEEDFS